jgi:hypothetical protein
MMNPNKLVQRLSVSGAFFMEHAQEKVQLAQQKSVQELLKLDETGNKLGLGKADLEQTIVNIIQWVLGILSLLAVVFIIYGGFKWLTSGGDENRIESAKKTITAAVAGLVVVILAWAIVIFVAGTTANVTGLN